jgi:hypothetical protein
MRIAMSIAKAEGAALGGPFWIEGAMDGFREHALREPGPALKGTQGPLQKPTLREIQKPRQRIVQDFDVSLSIEHEERRWHRFSQGSLVLHRHHGRIEGFPEIRFVQQAEHVPRYAVSELGAGNDPDDFRSPGVELKKEGKDIDRLPGREGIKQPCEGPRCAGAVRSQKRSQGLPFTGLLPRLVRTPGL